MAIRLEVNGHGFIISDIDGTAEIREDGQPRSLRHHRMTHTQRVTVFEHDDGRNPPIAEHRGDTHLELSVEHVED